MIFYPRIQENLPEAVNIKYSKKHGCYFLNRGGESIGYASLNKEEILQIKSGDKTILESLPQFNKEYVEIASYMEDFKLTSDTYMAELELHSETSTNELPLGVFNVQFVANQIAFVPFKTGLKAPSTIIKNKNLKELVKDFYNNPRVGRKNKMATLLYGPPGNGKTTEIMELFTLCEEFEMRIFMVNKKISMDMLNAAKPLLELERTLFIFEEMTERTRQQGVEDILTFLDGENSWNNSVTIGTTNYPEDFPPNLLDRPGRFDTFIEYGNPSEEEIKALAVKFNFTPEDADILSGKGLSFDYCSFMFSSAKSNNLTVAEAYTKETEKRRKISTTFKGRIGFGL